MNLAVTSGNGNTYLMADRVFKMKINTNRQVLFVTAF
jgi:hypothetical protein